MRRLRFPLMFAIAIVAALVVGYYFFQHGRSQSTDDAYVNVARISISANVAGRVVALEVHDNQRVQRGQVLFRLDDRPFRIAVEYAQAKLDAARLSIEALKATRLQKVSELKAARETLEYEEREAKREQKLSSSGISSQSKVDLVIHARNAARQAVATAAQDIASITAKLGGDPAIDPADHPAVEQAQAELDRATLNLSYTTIKAPDDGIVTQVDQLHVGDYVNVAKPVFALVAVHDAWIDANFKEVQLADIRVGQYATITIDAYGDKTFDGHVASFTPGTGEAFSLLPPQNATGNWVKVVQRLAVRIELDQRDPAYPLFAGLSATVRIDTEDRSGARPSAMTQPASNDAGARSGADLPSITP